MKPPTDIERISEPYYIAQADNPGELALEVSRFIVAGWKPLGGVAAFSLGLSAKFVQALTR